MYHPSVSDGHDNGPTKESKKSTPSVAKKKTMIITESEKKDKVIKTMLGLGFDIDLDRWDIQGFIRFAHPINKASDFCVVWYSGMYDLDNLNQASRTLLKLGQHQKIQQLTSYI